MASIGHAILPWTVSIEGITGELNKQIAKPAKAAAKQAGQSIRKEMSDGASKAAKAVEDAKDRENKANYRVKKSQDELTAAKQKEADATANQRVRENELKKVRLEQEGKVEQKERRIKELRESGSATAQQITDAENDLNATRAGADAKIEAKELQVDKARRGTKEATDNLTAAEDEVTTAKARASEATEELTEAEQTASEEAEKSSKKVELFGLSLKQMGAFAVAGGSAVVGAMLKIGSEFDGVSRTIRVGTGATGDDLKELESVAQDVATTVPVSFDEAGQAIAGLNTYTGATGESLENLSSQVLEASNLLGEDGVSNAEAYGKALTQWEVDADTGAAAIDGLFKVTQDYGVGLGELTGHLNQYGSVLQNAGFSMEEASVLFGSLESSGLSVSRIMPGLNKAFRDWSSEGEDVQEMLGNTVTAIEEAETSQEALSLATDTFGAEGAQRLTTAIRNGSFALEDFGDVLGDTEGLVGDTAEETRTFSEMWTLLKNEGLAAIEPVASRVFDLFMDFAKILRDNLLPALEDFWGVIQNVGGWMKDNETVLKGVAAVVGGAAAAWGLWVGAIKTWQTVTKIATGIQVAFNAVMSANPIMLVVTAISALVAGLVYFFTQTETGKKVWENLVDAFKTAWGWIKDTFGPVFEWLGDVVSSAWEGIKSGWDILASGIESAWNNIIKPVFDFFVEAGKVLVAIIVTAVITPIMVAWDLLSSAWQAAYDNVIKPVIDWFAEKITTFYENVIRPVIDWIIDQWNKMGERWQWVKDNLIQPVIDAFSAAMTWFRDYIITPVIDFIKRVWRGLGVMWDATYNTVIKPVIDGFGVVLNWLKDKVVRPVIDFIMDRWDDMGSAIEWVKEKVIDPVFDGLGSGLDTLKGWFETTVDAIKDTWNKVKGYVAEPIKFVVDTVFNNGILEAWNAVVGFINMDHKKLDKIDVSDWGNYKTGGVLPGYTPGRDVHNFVSPTGGRLHLSGGEAIMRPEWTRAVGGPAAVESMNKDARAGKVNKQQNAAIKESHSHALGGVMRFADGGVISAMENIIGKKYPMLVPVFSGYRAGANDYHGQGLAGDFSNGTSNTPEMLALANDIADTYPNSLELIHEAPGFERQIKKGEFVGGGGGSHGYFAGAGDHANHVHWAMDTPPTMDFGGGVFEGGSDGGGGGGFFGKIVDVVSSTIKPIWDKAIDAIPGYEGIKGWAAEVPPNFLKTTAGMAWDFVKEKARALFPFGGGGGSSMDVSDVSGPVVDQVEEVFARAGWTGQQWEDAKWIIGQESSWDPSATNPSSGAFGLFQFNPMGGDTLGTYLPDRSTDPAVQAEAGTRYIRDRYGDPSAARAFWEANGWYADGGVLPELSAGLFDSGGMLGDKQLALNLSGENEPVFTQAQWKILQGNIMTRAQSMDWAGVMVELEKVAGALEQAVSAVDWDAIASAAGETFGTKFAEGQMSDIQSVFGIPAYDSIPAVKAMQEWDAAVQDAADKAAEETAKDAEASERTADAAEDIAAEVNESTSGDDDPSPDDVTPTNEPEPLPSGGFARNAGRAMQAAGVPGAANAGNTIQIITGDLAGAMQKFRTISAKNNAGLIGV